MLGGPTGIDVDGPPTTTGRHPWWTLASVALGVFMVGLDGSVVAIANPAIAADLHASLEDLQWITNAYLLAMAALLITGGKLGDKFGRRRVFLAGVAGFGLTSVGIGVIGRTEGVIGLRAMQGLFAALLMPNTLAIVRSTFPAEKLNTAIGIWGGASAVSVALGPIAGGLLVEHVNWESVFFINAPIAVLALAIGVLAVGESRSTDADERLDWAGILALSGAMVLEVYGLVKASEWGWDSGRTLGFLVAGVAVFAVFVLIEQRVSHPLLPLRLFNNATLSVGTVVVLINMFAMLGGLFFMTLYFQSVQGFSAVEAGVRTLPLSVSLIVAAPIGGLLTEKLGPRVPMVIGMVGVAAGLGLLTSLEVDSGFLHIWPGFVLLGVGIGFVMTASAEAIVGNASVDDAGIAGGVQNTALQLGGVLGTAVLGSVLSSRVGSVLHGDLVAAGTPSEVATQLQAAKAYVAQGVAPTVDGVPAAVQEAILTGSHEAFMAGLHTSMYVAVGVAVVGAALALLVKPVPREEAAPEHDAEPQAAI
ncbi:MAG: MFS transporter [Acidimicrobiaceae bacterium]|nr:MFS transporter [Acidimicrobiaceae bacterium]